MNDRKPIPDYYHVYEQANRNGLKYDISIDNVIINQLNATGTINYGKLKHATEQLVGRILSPDTFSGHLEVLMKCKILSKADGGRGKDVLYSLTESAKKLLQLNLLGYDWEKIRLFNKIYERFFLSDLLNEPLLILKTEDEFDSFLSDIEVKRDDLNWGTISTADNGDGLDLVYKDYRPSRYSDSRYKKYVKEYWQKKGTQTTVCDKLVFFCFPKGPYNTDIMVHRNEYWQINKNSPSIMQQVEYSAIVPGVSINDVVEGRAPKLSYNDVEKAFDLLRQANLIEPAFRFRGQIRYKVKDNNEKLHTGLDLRNFLSTLKAFYNEEFSLLLFKWKHFEGPTDDEIKRWKWILGDEEANRIFNDIELKRYENRKGMRQCKNTLEYHKFLNSVCPKEFVSAAYGPWPYSSILYDFRQKREEEKIKQSIRTGKKSWARKKKMRLTKKEIATDKIEYEKFLRKKLEAQILYLPINHENEGIEDFRIFFSTAFQKYPFLRQIMRYICPRFLGFDLTDEETEMGAAYNKIERPTTEEGKRVKDDIPDITKMLLNPKKREK